MSKRFCKVCGSAYSYCPGCVKDMDKPRWMSSFDSENCKKVFDALVANSAGKMTDSETLAVVDGSGVKVVSASILSHLNRIRGNKDVVVEEKKSEEVVEAPAPVVKEEVKEEPVEMEQMSLFKQDVKEEAPSKDNEKNESAEESVSRSIGSLFNKNNFSSNSKNKEKVKQDAASIASALDQLNEKQGL